MKKVDFVVLSLLIFSLSLGQVSSRVGLKAGLNYGILKFNSTNFTGGCRHIGL